MTLDQPVPSVLVDNQALMDAHEVARRLDVSVNTVKRLVGKGVLPAYRIVPRGDLRFSLADLEAFLATRRVNR